MQSTVKVGINGFGRIGRAVFRVNHENPRFEVVAINDINPDAANLAYTLKYDTEYGRFKGGVDVSGGGLIVDGQKISVFHKSAIDDVPWADLGCEVVIDASGVHTNVEAAPEVISSGVNKVVVTHTYEGLVDFTMVLGVNEEDYDPSSQHVISSSICDSVAASPLIKLIDDKVGIDSGFLTTLHPWLSYQNVLDGPSISWTWPGQLYHHFAVGRSSVGTLIPKPTSAVQAISMVLPDVAEKLQCMSFRIPTPVVGAANLYLHLKEDTTVEAVHEWIEESIRSQSWPIFNTTLEPLVSVDFVGTSESLTLDKRWTEMSSPRHLFLVFWYDNEWGYASRVVDTVCLVSK